MKNVSILNFENGIRVPKSANFYSEDARFTNVENCFSFYDSTTENINSPCAINFGCPTPKQEIKNALNNYGKKNNNSSNIVLENINKKIIQNLFNLEINSLIKRDYKNLNKIRSLKGLVGSEYFKNTYSILER